MTPGPPSKSMRAYLKNKLNKQNNGYLTFPTCAAKATFLSWKLQLVLNGHPWLWFCPVYSATYISSPLHSE
jgi:hypothetical protein